MFRRITILVLCVVVVAGCGSAATATPGTTATPGGETTPTAAGSQAGGGGGQTTAPNTGDLKAKAKALLPSDASIVSEATAGGLYSVSATSKTSVADLEPFFEQKLKDLGINETGKYTASGTLVIAFSNPDGGITAGPDSSGNTVIAISIGTSS